MAKKRASGTSAFNNWVGSIPREENFRLTMQIDTTTATYVDIDTNLLDGYAWALYGISYTIQDPTTFHNVLIGATSGEAWTLQVHRNDDHTALIAYDDDDLWIHDHHEAVVSTQGGYYFQGPFKQSKPHVTFGGTLRVMFRTDNDIATIDAADLFIGKIYYDIVKAPTAAQTKLGYLGEL